MLAMQLTLRPLARRRPDDPVPVLLSVSSWNPTAEHLDAWIARRLEEDYPGLKNTAAYGPAVAQQLVAIGRVLPICDGLDEMPAALRATAIGNLDRASAGRPLVVTCRSEEYQQAISTGGEVLSAAAVVEIQPVTLEQIINFVQATIASTDTRWESAFSHLRANPNGALAAALASPLMVALARTIYTSPNRDPGTLVTLASASDQATVEQHLLDSFLPAVYADRPAPPGKYTSVVRRRWDSAAAQRYLAFLAGYIQQHNTRDLAWWEIKHAASKGVMRAVGALTGAFWISIFGGVVGVVVGAFAGWVVGAVLGGVAGGLVGGFTSEAKIAPRRLSARGKLRDLVRILPPSLCVWDRGRAADRTRAGIQDRAHNWAFFRACADGLDMLDVPADYAMAVTPQSVFKSDRAVAAISAIMFGITLGIIIGLLVVSQVGLVLALLFGLVFGLLITAGGMFTIGFFDEAWGQFVVARAWLAIRGRLPWRLMAFLDDAYHRGVLRQAGAVYQFRHARLQDQLADSAARPQSRM